MYALCHECVVMASTMNQDFTENHVIKKVGQNDLQFRLLYFVQVDQEFWKRLREQRFHLGFEPIQGIR